MKKISQQNSLSAAQCEMPAEQLPEIIRYPITVGRNVRRPEEISIRDIAYVMAFAIKGGCYEGFDLKERIMAIRAMESKVAITTAKSALPWFCGSVMARRRANANVQSAQFMVFDLDHVGVANSDLPQPKRNSATQDQAIEELKALAMNKLPWLRYAFRSVSDGVKLIAQFSQPITSEEVYRRVYIFLALQIEWAVKHICDATPDWARACFMSYDPALLCNERCQPLDPKVSYKQAISVMEIPFPVGRASVGTDILSVYADGTDILSVHADGTDILSVHADGTSAATAQSDYAKVGTDILSVHADGTSAATAQSDYAKAEQIIGIMSKIPIAYKDWVKLGQALYAGFGEQGKALWDMFLGNPYYKDSQVMIDAHWRSFRSTHSVTLASLFYLAEKYGVRYE